VAYKLSERLNQDSPTEDSVLDDIDLDKVKNVFLFFGILSLLTAWFFSFDSGTISKSSVRPTIVAEDGVQAAPDTEEKYIAAIGPLVVNKFKEVYSVAISSNLPVNSWAFVEGEVLDAKKDYLFSFGQELWHETGYDEGNWEEAENSYTMKITFPQPGKYYLNFKTQGSSNPDTINVIIKKHRGSSIPHMAFGIICLLIGIVLNETQNKTISKTLARIAKHSGEED
jgi:hypothetical protein